VETLPLFLVSLTRNIESQEIFKLNSLNHIIIKAELYRAQTGLTTAQTLAMSPPAASNPFDVCGAVVANSYRERPENTNTPSCCNCTLAEGEKPHLASYRGSSHERGEQQRRRAHQLLRNPLGGRSSLSSPHHSSPTQLHCVKTRNTSNHRHRRHMGKTCGLPCSSIYHYRKFRKQVC
jgi:hypothetical protein